MLSSIILLTIDGPEESGFPPVEYLYTLGPGESSERGGHLFSLVSGFRAGRFPCAVRGSRREAWLRSKCESRRLGVAGHRGIGRPRARRRRVAAALVLRSGMRGLCVRTSSLQRWLGRR